MKYSESQRKCLAFLEQGNATARQIQEGTGLSKDAVHAAISGLRANGDISLIEYQPSKVRGRVVVAIYGLGCFDEPEKPDGKPKKVDATVRIKTPHIRKTKWLSMVAQL